MYSDQALAVPKNMIDLCKSKNGCNEHTFFVPYGLFWVCSLDSLKNLKCSRLFAHGLNWLLWVFFSNISLIVDEFDELSMKINFIFVALLSMFLPFWKILSQNSQELRILKEKLSRLGCQNMPKYLQFSCKFFDVYPNSTKFQRYCNLYSFIIVITVMGS